MPENERDCGPDPEEDISWDPGANDPGEAELADLLDDSDE